MHLCVDDGCYQMTVTHEPLAVHQFLWVLVISSQDPLWKSHFHQIPLVIELNTNLNKLVVAGEELKRLGVTAAWTLLDDTAVN